MWPGTSGNDLLTYVQHDNAETGKASSEHGYLANPNKAFKNLPWICTGSPK